MIIWRNKMNLMRIDNYLTAAFEQAYKQSKKCVPYNTLINNLVAAWNEVHLSPKQRRSTLIKTLTNKFDAYCDFRDDGGEY